jgi:hypothetical protein
MPHAVGLLWTSDQSDEERSLPDNTQHVQEADIHAPVGFEPTIPASERPQTRALDGAATGIGSLSLSLSLYIYIYNSQYQPICTFFISEGNNGIEKV